MGSTIALIIGFLLFFTNSTLAQSIKSQETSSSTVSKKDPQDEPPKEEQEEEREPLDFSDTGRPGQQTAGESRGNCSNIDRPMKALIPVSHSGKTVSAHPSFWVYLPYTSEEVSHVEFILQNEAREDIWRSPFALDRDIGYKSFSIPETATPLEVGQWYRWYIKVYCDTQTASSQYVQGWVNRVPLTSGLYLELQQKSQTEHQTYGNYGIWYDAIDRLLREYKSQPSNLVLEGDWQNLIEAKGVELKNLPQVGSSYKVVK
ncbi:DUF928 domain-containing protein [Waterburya agarophytonicola K14]|uniref:DUF928 domain-containing protein n=1 Tax=Waterburya agarophytonicola KI4 TaxID=2874699 RepID=A0A964BMF4_9CYAN|nr:DUF928 domain-containing protein [Waterburya agarophytonicola]MCC0176025.1 DUF928 domain-containing protein [Waterburya agarophytonicola KI4]